MSYKVSLVTPKQRIRCVCPTCKNVHTHVARRTLVSLEFPSAYARIYRRAGWDPSDHHLPNTRALDALPPIEHAIRSISSMPLLYADLSPTPLDTLKPLISLRSFCQSHPDSAVYVEC